MQMPEEQKGVPSHWKVYFSVKNCKDSQEKAEKLGAKILAPMFPISKTGYASILQDPQGAVFAIVHFDEKAV